MESHTLRHLASPRPLIPGTRLTIRTATGGLAAGEHVAVTRGPVTRGAIATEALLDDVAGAGPDSWYVAMSGIRLVVVTESAVDRDPSVVAVTRVDRGELDAGPLVERARRALRTYHARRVEAGEWADVLVDVSEDPVAASHEVASYLKISAPEIQELLEAGDAGERLTRSIRILERESDLLARTIGRKGG